LQTEQRIVPGLKVESSRTETSPMPVGFVVLSARDQVGHLRDPRGMKSLDRLLGRPVGLGDAFVLAQVFEPGFHKERFQQACFFASILKNAPRTGAVTPFRKSYPDVLVVQPG